MGKVSFFSGIGLIALSGILFTFERFIAAFLYGIEVFSIQLNENGSYGPLEMPGLFDNFYVGFLLALGLILFIFGAMKITKNQK
ncbi:hypothetical protein [Lentibacillus sp. CBA3610]|uniref:hypothetical protein n=1 Tax=Lentibacillus sp. CBA3610 TaxID=2518176 RepID=UPI00159546B6|nr:hypothetical protein [Lentibacillus sp. CBA3610]QKY69405.1 hypothetical protein Len3610_07195 [Lentibacillus sp. CBA3610]